METIISVHSTTFPLEELEKNITHNENQKLSVNLKLERNIDPTLLIAIITTSGTILGALLTNILYIIRDIVNGQKIVIKSKEGTSLEINSGISEKKLNKFIKKLKDIDSKDISIYLP